MQFQILKDPETGEQLLMNTNDPKFVFMVEDVSDLPKADIAVMEQATELCALVTSAGSRYRITVYNGDPDYIETLSYEEFDKILRKEISGASRWLYNHILTQNN